MTPFRATWAATLLMSGMLAQEALWELPGHVRSQVAWYNMSTFRDFDGDGVRDVIVRYIDDPLVNYWSAIEVLSGRSGARLWTLSRPGAVDVRDAGDCDGDSHPDILVRYPGSQRSFELWSTRTNSLFLSVPAVTGVSLYGWGDVLLADIDLDGNGKQDVLVATNHVQHSTLYAYNHTGALLWQVDHRAQGRFVYSIGHYGDFNHDGHDDFLLGLQGDPNGVGIVAICSGLDGSFLQQSFGVQVGNYMCDHVTNVGDVDGDGVHDYAGFPAWFTYTGDCAIFSGANGSVLRTWIDYAESVVAGPDFDLDRDGVPDLLISNEQLVAPNTYGRTRAISGRDGQELWRVDAIPYVPDAPTPALPGYYGWGRYAVSLGTWPDRAYPSLAWMELGYYMVGNQSGRIRAWGGEHVGQGPIKGHACSSNDTLPLIGVRKNGNGGARITLANAPPAAFAVLVLSLQSAPTTVGAHALPLDLGPLGMPGCLLQLAPDALYWRITGNGPGHARGYCHVDLPIHLTATGVPAFAQWLAYDPVTLDFAGTEVHTLRGL